LTKNFCSVLAVATCFALSALPAQAIKTLDGSEGKFDESELKEFVIGLAESVRDPLSAQFHSLQRSPENMAGKYICGFANLKNGMGGYDGFKPFWYKVRDKSFFVFEAFDQPKSIAHDFELLKFERSGCEMVIDLN